MSTFFQSNEDALESRKWLLVDADGIPVGRLASEVASLIRGKHKPTFTPHVDGGDFVIVVNADKVKLTGNKLSKKIYYSHSTYIGGIKQINAEDLMEKSPQKLIQRAVEGMLPQGALGNSLATKLKIYVGTDHPHQAQKPEQYKIKSVQNN